MARALELSNGDSGGFFREACVNLTSEQFSCNVTCDGVYRTFDGCCNNLINTEYGQIMKFYLSNVLEFHYITGRTNSPLLRLLPAAYESGTLPRGGLVNSTLPSARTVRKVVKPFGHEITFLSLISLTFMHMYIYIISSYVCSNVV